MTQNPTDEERRAKVYSEEHLYTVPSTVSHDTPLESLNLNWRESDLPERERTKHVHRLHPYLGKFIPQLAEIFLRKYFSPGQTVLDPFVGSGTMLVQANELGINSVGYDISAFNVLLSRGKTAHYDLQKVDDEITDILKRVRYATQDNINSLPLFQSLSPQIIESETDSSYLKQWFAPQALRELITYRNLIESKEYTYKDLLKVILSRAARSARLTTHFDLDFPKLPQTEPYWCYKHSRMCSPTTGALKFLERYSEDTVKRLREFGAIRTNAEVKVIHGDSRTVPFPKIHGVITSPPYVGLINYHEQHAYAYHLLGLENHDESEIGPAAKGVSRKAQKHYLDDIFIVFRNALEAMSSGGYLIVVAGDKLNLYGEIANMLGVEVEYVVQRHVNRRTGRRSNQFYESVFIWRKP